MNDSVLDSPPHPLDASTRPIALAVVVVSYNVRDLLAACLDATFASLARSPELDASVWVVDNASADGSAAMVAADFPQVRLIRSQQNLGFAGGNNLALTTLGYGRRAEEQAPPTASGVRSRPRGRRAGFGAEERSEGEGERSSRNAQYAIRAQGPAPAPDLVLLLNPDAEPAGDAIGQMARFLQEHPRVGGAGSQLEYPDGRFQHGAFRFPGLLQLWFDLFPPRPARLLDSRLNGRYPRRLYAAGRPFAIDFALGASLMVRREAIQAAGLLDEGYFMYAEEVDWCWRMQAAGWPLWCVPSARVVHHGGASTRQFRSRSFVNLWRSRQRLFRRFYGPVRRWAAARIVQLGMGAEIRRARAASEAGEISQEEAAARVAAASEVADLFRGRMLKR